MARFLLGLGVALAALLLALLVVGFNVLSRSPGFTNSHGGGATASCLDARIDELRPVTALCGHELSGGAR